MTPTIILNVLVFTTYEKLQQEYNVVSTHCQRHTSWTLYIYRNFGKASACDNVMLIRNMLRIGVDGQNLLIILHQSLPTYR